MPRALWTPQAAEELDDILFYVSVRDGRPQTGESIYFEIRQLADEHAASTAARHSHPLAPRGWYYFLYKRWLVFYQLHGEGIEVMRVIDGTRDLPTLIP
jgi:plasmid stabilization system protein ParE